MSPIEFNEFSKEYDLMMEQVQQLEEKLLLANKAKKGGQIIFLAGGAGSGKGFALQKFIDSRGFKVRDVDEWKKAFMKIARLKNKYREIQNLDLRNPDDVFRLHEFVSSLGIKDKTLDNMLSQLKGRDRSRRPNIVFDITLKNIDSLKEYSKVLQEAGYEPEDMHVVWVLSNFNIALERNRKRSRVVPEDILIKTHKGAAKAMTDIITGGLSRRVIDGEIHVILNNNEETEFYRDSEGNVIISGDKTGRIKPGQKGQSPIGTELGKAGELSTGEDPAQRWTIKNFTSIQVKRAGKPIQSKGYEKKGNRVTSYVIQDQIFQWMKANIPASARSELFGE